MTDFEEAEEPTKPLAGDPEAPLDWSDPNKPSVVAHYDDVTAVDGVPQPVEDDAVTEPVLRKETP